jgi:ABC-2 type transport system permease protein
VRDGSFDLMLVKPVNTQFLATFRRSEIGALLFDSLAGLAMVVIGLARAGAGFSIVRVLGWALFAASGAAVGYALWVIPISLVFRIVRADALAGLADSFWDFNNVPMVVWGRRAQAIGTYAIPIFLVTNYPALFALGRMSPINFAWGLAAPFIFGFIASRCWKAGIRRYEGGGN